METRAASLLSRHWVRIVVNCGSPVTAALWVSHQAPSKRQGSTWLTCNKGSGTQDAHLSHCKLVFLSEVSLEQKGGLMTLEPCPLKGWMGLEQPAH